MTEQPIRRDRRMARRMQSRGRSLFTGRAQETTLFQQTLRAFQGLGDDEPELKTAFSVYGQGGAGKTTLLREFEAICLAERVEYIYVDAQLESGESIFNLVELMRSIRRHFSQKGFQTALDQSPFAAFDESYERYKALEERVRREHERRQSARKYDAGQDDPADGAQRTGDGRVVSSPPRARGIGSLTPRSEREWFVSALGNMEDVEFFQRPEALLVEQFSDALDRLWGDGIFALMLDTYEKLDRIDVDIRDTFLAQLNVNLVVVFAGRHSLHDRFNLMWRDSTHFLELRPFDEAEVADYLMRRGLSYAELAGPIHAFTRGWPLAVGLAADAAERAPSADAAMALFAPGRGTPEDRLQILDSVAERLLNQVAEEERAAIWAAAALTIFGQAELQAVVGGAPLRPKQFQQLTAYSFIVRAGAGFAVHDLVRDYILRSLKERHPDAFRAMQRRAADYYFDQQRARAADVEAGAWRSAEWRTQTKEYLYHSMQADEPAGVQLLFRHLAEALYERNYQYTQQLAQLIRRTLPITTINLHNLERCCAAVQAGDVARACALLEDDLARPDLPRPQRYLLAMTLGHLRVQWPFWNYAEALVHFVAARETAQALVSAYAPAERNGAERTAALAADTRPVVVLSYTSFDDEYENGSLTSFRKELHRALHFSGGEIEIFQDLDIAPGQQIEERIRQSLSAGVMLIPIITPNFFKSEARRRELSLFLERERQLGRDDLIFWVYYHPVEGLDAVKGSPAAVDRATDPLMRELARRKSIDWRPYRGRSFVDAEVRAQLELIAQRMLAVVRSLAPATPVSPSAQAGPDPAGAHYPAWLALALAHQGACHARLSQWAPAIAALQTALAQAEVTGEQQTILRCLIQLGAAYREQERYDQAIALFEDGLRHDLRAAPALHLDLLQELGQTYQGQGKYQQAIDYLGQARDLAQEVRHEHRLAEAWQLLGLAYRDWGKYDEAMDCFQAGLRAAEGERHAARVADLLIWMGWTCWSRKDYAGAITYFTQSRDRYRTLDQATAAAYASDSIGDMYRAWTKYDQALAHYEEARAGYEAEGELEKLAGLIGGIGILHQERGDYERSVAYHLESRWLYEQLGKADNVAGAWLSLGHSYREWAKYEQAVEHYEAARERYELIGKGAMAASALMNIGLTYQAQGNYPQAIEQLTRARDLYEHLDRPVDTANLWTHLGETYRLWRKYDEALAAYQEGYTRFEALQQHSSLANQLFSIGRVHLNRHSYDQAIVFFTRSRDMFAELGEGMSEADLWGWMGDTYRGWGNLDEAIAHYQEAYRRHTALDNELNAAWQMCNIGLAYRERETFAQAVEAFQQSLAIQERLDRPQDVAYLWDHLGAAYRLWGKLDEAISHYSEALRRHTALGNLDHQANILVGLALTYRHRGMYARAVEYFEQSQALREQLDQPVEVASLYGYLGDVYRDWGKLDEAIAHYQEAGERHSALESQLLVALQYYKLGLAYRARGAYARAIEHLRRSRDLYEQHTSLQNAAWVWYYLGQTYAQWGQLRRGHRPPGGGPSPARSEWESAQCRRNSSPHRHHLPIAATVRPRSRCNRRVPRSLHAAGSPVRHRPGLERSRLCLYAVEQV